MIAQILVVGVLPLLMVLAAVWDLASYTIPNALQLAGVAAFVALALIIGLPLATAGYHLLAGICALLLGFACFAFGWLGGGDAKLLAVVSLWLGPQDAFVFLLAAAICGGALSIFILVFRKILVTGWMTRTAWIQRLHDPKSGIPYGVAMAAGFLLVLPHTKIFAAALKITL